MSRPAESIRARDLPVRALGPRRSHSISRRTLVASASCLLRLGFQKILALLKKFAVVALHLERAAGIDAIQFHHVGGDAFEKVAIVRDDQTRARVFDGCFKPENAFEIQMIGGFVEKQNVGQRDQRCRDRQAASSIRRRARWWASCDH